MNDILSPEMIGGTMGGMEDAELSIEPEEFEDPEFFDFRAIIRSKQEAEHLIDPTLNRFNIEDIYSKEMDRESLASMKIRSQLASSGGTFDNASVFSQEYQPVRLSMEELMNLNSSWDPTPKAVQIGSNQLSPHGFETPAGLATPDESYPLVNE
jgi:hypothetical protein